MKYIIIYFTFLKNVKTKRIKIIQFKTEAKIQSKDIHFEIDSRELI